MQIKSGSLLHQYLTCFIPSRKVENNDLDTCSLIWELVIRTFMISWATTCITIYGGFLLAGLAVLLTHWYITTPVIILLIVIAACAIAYALAWAFTNEITIPVFNEDSVVAKSYKSFKSKYCVPIKVVDND